LTEVGLNPADLPVLGGESGAPQVDRPEELAVVEQDRRLVGHVIEVSKKRVFCLICG
jgi:hypothetical protein